MTEIEKIKARMARLAGKLNAAKEELCNAIRNTHILCAKCGKEAALRTWKFIQDKYYVRPYSCNEGDYWVSSETKLCHVVCPGCGAENYIYIHPHCKNIVDLVNSHGFNKQALFDVVEERCNR